MTTDTNRLDYHLVIHLSGSSGRDVTQNEMQKLTQYLDKIRATRYVCCLEPAGFNHLHCAYTLLEERPNIKRDLLKSTQIDFKKYPRNAAYNKKLKVGQTFIMLAGGYLQKGYKRIITKGISHEELLEGKHQYEDLKERKVIKLSKHNLPRYLIEEIKKLDIKQNYTTFYQTYLTKHGITGNYRDDIIKRNHIKLLVRETLIKMLRNKYYNFNYVLNAFTQNQLVTLVHFGLKEPHPDEDEDMLDLFFKSEQERGNGFFYG